MQGSFTTIYQIFFLLAITCLYIGELATSKNGYKNFHRLQFSRVGIDKMKLLSGIIYIELITRFMIHMHGWAHLLLPQGIVKTELAKLKAIRMTGVIFLPHQLLGNPFTL